MKTVVSGVALAAILALAMPAWAQGTDAQQSNAPATGVSAPHAKKAHASQGMHAQGMHAQGMHARKTSHNNVHHAATHHSAMPRHAMQTRMTHRTTATARAGGTSPTDNVANQLNRAENQRLSGSSTAPMTEPDMASPGMAPMGAPNQPMRGQ